MDFADIVVGSGLSALGVVLGLADSPSVLVVAGTKTGTPQFYSGGSGSLCGHTGAGGLGNSWHGVIPLSLQRTFCDSAEESFSGFFRHFYPRASLAPYLGKAVLFVPWRAIRPLPALLGLQRERRTRLQIRFERATSFEIHGRGIRLRTASSEHSGRRLWLAAGPLATPFLVSRSLGVAAHRPYASDHVICYVGQCDDIAPPIVRRTGEGMFVSVDYDAHGESLYLARPARFDFRRLDASITERGVFGQPSGQVLASIARLRSPGLIAEALFNRAGIGATATRYNIYAQTQVQDAYELRDHPSLPLIARPDAIRAATDAARSSLPFPSASLSRRPENVLPGIHIHNTLERESLRSKGLDFPGSPVQIVDASTLDGIGGEHHSFKMMLAAFERARMAVSEA